MNEIKSKEQIEADLINNVKALLIKYPKEEWKVAKATLAPTHYHHNYPEYTITHPKVRAKFAITPSKFEPGALHGNINDLYSYGCGNYKMGILFKDIIDFFNVNEPKRLAKIEHEKMQEVSLILEDALYNVTE